MSDADKYSLAFFICMGILWALGVCYLMAGYYKMVQKKSYENWVKGGMFDKKSAKTWAEYERSYFKNKRESNE